MIKKAAFLCLFLVFLHVPAHADTDEVLFYTSTTLILLDWKSTHDLVIDEDHRERNLILGPNPSNKHINNYFISALVGNTFCYNLFPKKYKITYLITVIVLESLVIASNYSSNHARFNFKYEF